jgi:hypothetical protein
MFLKNGVTSHVFQKIGVTLNAASFDHDHERKTSIAKLTSWLVPLKFFIDP